MVIKDAMKNDYLGLKKLFGDSVRFNVDLRSLSTFGIGGSAKVFVKIKNYEELKKFIDYVNNRSIKYFIVGKGSNVLFADEGYDGVILRLDGYFRNVKIVNERVRVGAGALLSVVLNKTRKEGLSGLEFCVGIPGTVGGAIWGNAGLKEECVFDVVESVEGINNSGSKVFLEKEEIPYSYRCSGLKDLIVTFINFHFVKKPVREIEERINQYKERRKNQPVGEKSIGCIFRNPKGDFAGRLIEKAGLKGLRVGDAQVSDIHTNYIVNRGNAKARDVLSLIDRTKSEVRDKFNVELVTEIQVVR